jgi:CBS domain-containing protein
MSTRQQGVTTVGQLMSREPVVIRADAPLTDAVGLFDERRVHGLPVIDDEGALIGVISQTDMIRARTTEQLWVGWRGLRVRHLMTAPALTISADANLTDAAVQMEANGIHRLVVLAADGKSPEGIISSSDIVRAMVYDLPAAEEVGR